MKTARDWTVIALISVLSALALWLPVGMTKIYENFDGLYYVVIARSWYDKEFIGKNFAFPLPLEYYPAHFPLYPALIRLLGVVGYPNAMLAINLIATVAAALVMYKIFAEFKWGNPLWVSLVWLFFWPRMWVVRSVGSPETLFILWVILSLYFFQKKKYLWSGVVGALAVLTKSPGILLLVAYGLWFIAEYVKTKKINWRIWPVKLIGLALVGVFGFYWLRTGDFWAYFHSGDNIHIQAIPFKVFDSNQPWVGNWWLEDVLWIYLIGAVGVVRAFKKSSVWGWFGAVFYTVIVFVSHRDIARYSLPLVPVVLVGLADILEKKEVRWALALMLIPLYFYSLNFITHNAAAISDWTPFFAR